MSTVELFDTKRRRWRRLADLPAPRFMVQLAVLGEMVLAMGGANHTHSANQPLPAVSSEPFLCVASEPFLRPLRAMALLFSALLQQPSLSGRGASFTPADDKCECLIDLNACAGPDGWPCIVGTVDALNTTAAAAAPATSSSRGNGVGGAGWTAVGELATPRCRFAAAAMLPPT